MERGKNEKGDTGEKGEKGEKREKREKDRKGDNSKNKKTGAKPIRIRKAEHTKQQDHISKEENLHALLKEALEKFPETCAKRDSNTEESSKRELENFARVFKPRLKAATTNPKHGEENLLHVIVKKSWTKEPKEKALLRWMLQQKEHQVLLELQDQRDCTPIHNALFEKQHDFVNIVLETEGLNIVSILKKRCSAGNCLHLATKQSFPNLSHMINKCADDREIFLGTEKSLEDTPLHIAVQQMLLLVKDDGDDPDSEDEMEEQGDDNEDQHSQRGQESVVGSDEDEFEKPGKDTDFDEKLDKMSEADDEDGQEAEAESYRPESPEEREIRLGQILDELDMESDRPRPPSRMRNTKPDTAQHPDTGEGRDGVPGEEERSSAPQDAPTQDVVELDPDHSVRLLVEACPEALSIENKAGRTPYQEREHALLEDPHARSVAESYAKHGTKVRPGDTEEVREARANRAFIAKDPVAHYIRSFCMRKSKTREETMERLYKPGHECHIEFDLDGLPAPVLKHQYLSQLEKHLKFESILKYVALPVLSVEAKPARNPRSQTTQHKKTDSEVLRKGRSDLIAVFDWLWRRGVREIVKVMVVDDGDVPHADAAIVEALYGFKVEIWDWKRVDLCSDVICDSSKAVREVSLYSSGNNAVLMGWASSEGLGNRKKFPHLEKVKLFVQDGLEDKDSWDRNTTCCSKQIIKHAGKGPSGKDIEVKIIPDNNPVKYASELSMTENIEVTPDWIKSVRDFSNFVFNASKSRGRGKEVPPVKIAIIDDGIDATVHNLQPKIAGGATFCHYPHSSELVNSYFVPRGKHGTLMAQLICDLCPGTQLYIARLEELPAPSASGRLVTARSAAKAVDWAVSCGVNIISMSWTIQTAAKETDDMKKLQNAIAAAYAANILMFCSASDQGANNMGDCFPGDWGQCVRIGAATFTGEKLTWVEDKVNFWFPGRNVPFPSADGKSVVYESGSSVATAAASGLAGLLFYSARLCDERALENDEHNPFRGNTAMTTAFTTMAKGPDNKFPRTDDIFNKMFKKKIQQATGTPNPTKSIDIETLEWTDVTKKALELLLTYIQAS